MIYLYDENFFQKYGFSNCRMYKNNRFLILVSFAWSKILTGGIDISGFITTGSQLSYYTNVWGQLIEGNDKTDLLLEISLKENKIFLYAAYPNQITAYFIGSGAWYLM